MPWKSDAQRRWGHSQAGKEALGGDSAVHEWDEATKGKKLPEKVSKAEIGMPKPAKVGIPSVKMPKAKTMPSAFDKPSKFFKSEDFNRVKHPSVRKLLDFVQKRHKGSQS
jgi:hypothetical protein